jgi:glutathione S-transferase
MADISCCGYLFWPEQTELDYTRWPHVQAWLDRIKALRGWADPYTLMQ